MKTIIAGPRTLYVSPGLVRDVVEASGFDVTEVVSGHATGVDSAGESYSYLHLEKAPTVFPAAWEKYRRSAGAIRNKQMAKYADAVIIIRQKGVLTPGTSHMIETAEQHNLMIYIHEV